MTQLSQMQGIELEEDRHSLFTRFMPEMPHSQSKRNRHWRTARL